MGVVFFHLFIESIKHVENVPHLGAEGGVLGSQLLNLLTELVLGELHARQLVDFGFPEEGGPRCI